MSSYSRSPAGIEMIFVNSFCYHGDSPGRTDNVTEIFIKD